MFSPSDLLTSVRQVSQLEIGIFLFPEKYAKEHSFPGIYREKFRVGTAVKQEHLAFRSCHRGPMLIRWNAPR